MTTVIHAKNLGKKYTIGHQRQERSNGAGKSTLLKSSPA